MIKKKALNHLVYYLSLLSIFLLGLAATIFVYPNIHLQIFTIIATICIYVAWGILHHKLSHELTLKIAVEYILIGILGLSVVFFIFMGGVGI